VYLDSATDAAAELKKLGGAKLILATAPGRGGTSSIAAGLARNGKLLAVGVSPQAISISVVQIVGARQNTQGWPSGSAIDSEDTLRFSGLTAVRPMIERYPLERAAERYDRMQSGKACFRVVLTMGA
jgi:D-arabinose 1-dehydrogenase-like Zn-dependent alcohol dehydrogenase